MNFYNQQDSNIRKTWILMSLFFVVVIALTWTFAQIYGNPEILYFGVAFSLVMNFTSYFFSDKIALSVSGARQIEREENKELYNIVENLCITAGIPVPKLFIIEDSVPNAFATGRNKENSSIAVTTGLLETLNKTELEGVIAHELSHIGNRDILISTIVVVLVGFIALISDFFLRISFWGGHRDRDDKGQTKILILLAGIVLAILSPIVAKIIQLAISRKREFLADATGVSLTRYPEGLASALEKISLHSGKMERANNAMAHLYISNPFGDEKHNTSWLSKIFSTHPPIEERVKILRGEKK